MQPTQEESYAYGIKLVDNRIEWNDNINETEMEIKEFEQDLIKKRLIELDETFEITEQLVTLYEKFVGGN